MALYTVKHGKYRDEQGGLHLAGQTFESDVAHEAGPFADQLIPANPSATPVVAPNEIQPPETQTSDKPQFIRRSRGGGGYYDIIRAGTDEAVNDKPVQGKQAAEDLVETLGGELTDEE